MRYVFRFGFALALGLVLMAGCSDENGEGGSGGTAGTGGMAGTGGSGGMPECQGPEDCDDGEECTTDTCAEGMCENAAVADGTLCLESSGVCLDGSCALLSCEGIEEGALCLADPLSGLVGTCFEGVCVETECGIDPDCTDYNDCTTETCMTPGVCTDPIAVQDGTSCAGGTCQGGECALQGTVLPCTEQGIRNAIAAGGGPYNFDCDGPATVVTEAEIVIDNDVILDGDGNLIVDGNAGHLVFSVPAGVVTELHGISIQHGNADFEGGGILNRGAMTLTNSTVSGNTANGPGGGIYNDFDATLTIVNSTLSGNTANAGGGIYNNLRVTLSVTNSTVSENTASWAGGAIATNSTLMLTNSTLSGNTSGEIAGAIYSHYGPVTVTNSTLSSNTARFAGSILIDDGPLVLTNSTVSGSASSETDPYRSSIVIDDGTMTVVNTLFDADCTIRGVAQSNGYNVESPGDSCGFDQATDQVNVTAEQLNLGPLQDNGGPTMTHALGAGSVAIDQIPAEDCVDADGAPLTTDQRGEPRPETGGTMCDVGAFEVQP